MNFRGRRRLPGSLTAPESELETPSASLSVLESGPTVGRAISAVLSASAAPPTSRRPISSRRRESGTAASSAATPNSATQGEAAIPIAPSAAAAATAKGRTARIPALARNSRAQTISAPISRIMGSAVISLIDPISAYA